MIEMMARRVFGMLVGVNLMRMRKVSVVSGLVMVAGLMMLRCFGVVMGGHAVVMSRLAVCVSCLLGHPGFLRPAGMFGPQAPSHHRCQGGRAGYGGFN